MDGEMSNESERGEWELQIKDFSVLGRCSAMYGNELMSDVCFVLGSRETCQVKIFAHKFILATASPVFYAMLYGPLAENGEIQITDIEPEAFKAMIKYLYTDKLDVDPNSLPAVKYCAKKYLLTGLSQACLRFLKSSLTKENALAIFEECVLVKEDEVAEECLKIIDAVASDILTSNEFTNINLETLKLILERQSFNAPETTIVEAALRWANAECARKNWNLSLENRRKALGDALFLIRFLALSQQTFADLRSKSSLLTDKEMVDIFLNYTAGHKPKLRFKSEPRSSNWEKCYLIGQDSFNIGAYYLISCGCIYFKFDYLVNCPFFEQSHLHHNRMQIDFEKPVEVKCELKNSHEELQVTTLAQDPYSESMIVSFPQSTRLETNVTYEVFLSWKQASPGNSNTVYGHSFGIKSYPNATIIFRFTHRASETEITDIHFIKSTRAIVN